MKALIVLLLAVFSFTAKAQVQRLVSVDPVMLAAIPDIRNQIVTNWQNLSDRQKGQQYEVVKALVARTGLTHRELYLLKHIAVSMERESLTNDRFLAAVAETLRAEVLSEPNSVSVINMYNVTSTLTNSPDDTELIMLILQKYRQRLADPSRNSTREPYRLLSYATSEVLSNFYTDKHRALDKYNKFITYSALFAPQGKSHQRAATSLPVVGGR